MKFSGFLTKVLVAAGLTVMTAICASAQPRAIGIRIGGKGLEASYQHSIEKDFIAADLGLDFGYGGPGFIAEASYNFVFAKPAWTDRGSWGIYAGPGLALGYTSDRMTYLKHWKDDKEIMHKIKTHPAGKGFMMAFTGQIGLEYTFWFPLQLSVDIRPYFGFHTGKFNGYRKTGFYNYGMMGFIPSLSVRYRF